MTHTHIRTHTQTTTHIYVEDEKFSAEKQGSVKMDSGHFGIVRVCGEEGSFW